MEKKENKINLNKSGKMAAVWILVGVFFFIFAIALIEPLKEPLGYSINGLSCSTTSNVFIKPVCFLLQGGVVLFVGSIIYFIFQFVWRKSKE